MIRIIGYSSDDIAYYRHGGEKPPKKRRYNTQPAQYTWPQLQRKNIKPGQFTCCYCETPLTSSNFTREHIVPIKRGGSDTISNIRPCCEDCNSEKDDMMIATYIQYLTLMLPEYPEGCDAYAITITKINNATQLL